MYTMALARLCDTLIVRFAYVKCTEGDGDVQMSTGLQANSDMSDGERTTILFRQLFPHQDFTRRAGKRKFLPLGPWWQVVQILSWEGKWGLFPA